MQRIRRRLAPAAGAVLVLLNGSALGAVIAVGAGTAITGFQVEVALEIRLAAGTGENVAAAQWDLIFDPNALEFVAMTAGPAAAAASKELDCNVLKPGTVRVLVSGLNLNVMADGVLATAKLRIRDGAAEGIQPVTLDGAILSDPYGETAPVTTEAGWVSIRVETAPLALFPGAAVCGFVICWIGTRYLSYRRRSGHGRRRRASRSLI